MNFIKIDPLVVSDVRKYGQFDITGCYNCGSCTVTCALSGDNASFPRRLIRYVRFGLKEPLNNSLEPWLCYYCGDCSKTCPRQAEPAEAMMTLRRYLTTQYDWTGISSRLYSSAGWRIGAHLAVGLLVIVLALFYHLSLKGMKTSEFLTVPMGMSHMFNIIIYFTVAVYLIPIFLLITNAVRMHRFAMRNKDICIPPSLYFEELKTLLQHGFIQKRLKDCADNKTEKTKWIKHFIVFSGFVLISILVLLFLKWFQTDNIYKLYHPQRWLGYLAAVALIYGSADMLVARMRKKEQAHRFSDMSDWMLPLMIFLTSVSGLAVHVFRYIDFPLAAHFAYFLHMITAAPMLIVEIPFGKLSHSLYRPLAIYFQAVKEKASTQQRAGEANAVE